jgi:hypothetical protein
VLRGGGLAERQQAEDQQRQRGQQERIAPGRLIARSADE